MSVLLHIIVICEVDHLHVRRQLYHLKHIVKSAHNVTSIKQSPVLKGHLFLVLHRKFHLNLTFFKRSSVLKGHFLFVPKVTY